MHASTIKGKKECLNYFLQPEKFC